MNRGAGRRCDIARRRYIATHKEVGGVPDLEYVAAEGKTSGRFPRDQPLFCSAKRKMVLRTASCWRGVSTRKL